MICHSKINEPYNLKGITFVEVFPDFENPENKLMLIVLDIWLYLICLLDDNTTMNSVYI